MDQGPNHRRPDEEEYELLSEPVLRQTNNQRIQYVCVWNVKKKAAN
jgi:hypothetical protein